jgi:hypothetical protein
MYLSLLVFFEYMPESLSEHFVGCLKFIFSGNIAASLFNLGRNYFGLAAITTGKTD